MTTHLELSSGSTLGDFRVERLLGRGASAAVYLARLAEVGDDPAVRPVALKVAGDAGARGLLAAEAELAGRVDHPGVVRIHGVHLDQHPPFLVQEYCAGGSLRQLLSAAGRLAPTEVSRRLLEILDALGAAHAAGVVHRDLKPENLLLDGPAPGEGRLRIADFGLAEVPTAESLLLSEGLASQGGVAGTLDYMAPEQREGKGDHRVDLYAIGVIAFELLTGQRPDRNDRLEDFVDLPAAELERWEAFYTGCCARLDRRFRDAATAAAALTASTEGPAPRPIDPAPSQPRILPAVVALAMVLGMIAALTLTSSGSKQAHDVPVVDPPKGELVVIPDVPRRLDYGVKKSLFRAYEVSVANSGTHEALAGMPDVDAVTVLLNALTRLDFATRKDRQVADRIFLALERRTGLARPAGYDPTDQSESGETGRAQAREVWFIRYHEGKIGK